MLDIPRFVFNWFITTFGVIGVLLLIAYLTPRKFEQWLTLMTRGLRRVPVIYRLIQRLGVRLLLQRRVNRQLAKLHRGAAVPVGAEKLRINWVPLPNAEKDFVERGRVVVCLKSSEHPTENFVRAVYTYTSGALLPLTKPYLITAQREAMDLFVAGKLLEESDRAIRTHFLTEYLLPATGTEEPTELSSYFVAFEDLARAGLFYEFFLDELDYAGRKIFGSPRAKSFPVEVDDLLQFARRVSHRQSREQMNLTFQRDYFRCSVVIVGTPAKIAEPERYVAYIRSSLVGRGIESIHLLGFWDNRRFLDNVANNLKDSHAVTRRHKADVVLSTGLRATSYAITLVPRLATPFLPTLDGNEEVGDGTKDERDGEREAPEVVAIPSP
ncbi:MAG: hypothetical protein M3198_14335, partial [Actinomycetota bacterium]|nr:hypothetical protein [Actinomycetota bacterium]